MLCVLLLAECQVLVSFFFCLAKCLSQAFYFLFEILSSNSELKLGLGEVLCEGAYCCLSFLNLAHVGFSQGWNFILVSLSKFVDLTLCLLFSDYWLTLIVSETLKNSLVV